MPRRDTDPASLVHFFVNPATGLLTPEATQFLERLRRQVHRTAAALGMAEDTAVPDLRPVGVGQEWVTFAASDRKANTQYTNDTGRTISVAAATIDTGTGTPTPTAHTEANVYINGVLRYRNVGYGNSGTTRAGVCFPVPPGATYEIRCHISDDIQSWSELR